MNTAMYCYLPPREQAIPPDCFHLDASVPRELRDLLSCYGLHTTGAHRGGATAAELGFAAAAGRTLITKVNAAELFFSTEHAGVLICHLRATAAEIVRHIINHHPLVYPFTEPLERPLCFLTVSPSGD